MLQERFKPNHLNIIIINTYYDYYYYNNYD